MKRTIYIIVDSSLLSSRKEKDEKSKIHAWQMEEGMVRYLSARESGQQNTEQTDEVWQETKQIQKNLKKVLDKQRKAW